MKPVFFLRYDHKGTNGQDRGRSVLVDASDSRTNVQKNFRSKVELDEMISSTECHCGGGSKKTFEETFLKG